MPVVLIGIDHRASSRELLDLATVNAEALPAILERLAKSDHITEVVVVSTCLRTEIYVEAVRFHGAVRDARAVLSELAQSPPDQLFDSVFELTEETAYIHLFRVVAGIESSVVGEPEVLGQIARAWEVARDNGVARGILNGLFKRAVEVGKRARTETAISRGATSIGQAAVAMARANVGDLARKNVLIVGAGDMGASMAVALTDKNGANVTVTNRTPERATELAQRVGGEAVDFDKLAQLIANADVILTSTGAHEPVITGEMVHSAMSVRDGKPIVLVDVGVPADVSSDVRAIDGVTVLDIADLTDFAAFGRAERAGEIVAVEAIIEEEVDRYVSDVNARAIVPVLAALRQRVEFLRDAELARQGKRIADLDPEAAAAVTAIVNAVVAKLLHEPTVRLKAVAGSPIAERLTEAVRYLFDVDE